MRRSAIAAVVAASLMLGLVPASASAASLVGNWARPDNVAMSITKRKHGKYIGRSTSTVAKVGDPSCKISAGTAVLSMKKTRRKRRAFSGTTRQFTASSRCQTTKFPSSIKLAPDGNSFTLKIRAGNGTFTESWNRL